MGKEQGRGELMGKKVVEKIEEKIGEIEQRRRKAQRGGDEKNVRSGEEKREEEEESRKEEAADVTVCDFHIRAQVSPFWVNTE